MPEQSGKKPKKYENGGHYEEDMNIVRRILLKQMVWNILAKLLKCQLTSETENGEDREKQEVFEREKERKSERVFVPQKEIVRERDK